MIAYTAHKIAQYIGGTMKKILYKSLRRPFTPLGISLIGIMSGMSITVTRLLTFYPIPALRFDPGGPAIIMLAGMIMGPIGGALVGGLSDLIGFLFWNPTGLPWNPLIFTAQVLYGFIAGLIMLVSWNEDSKIMRIIQISIAVVASKMFGFIFITWGLVLLLHLPFLELVISRIVFQPFFIVWYVILCVVILQVARLAVSWRRYESKA